MGRYSTDSSHGSGDCREWGVTKKVRLESRLPGYKKGMYEVHVSSAFIMKRLVKCRLC